MKRVEQRVKDIVEVCPFTPLNDFSVDAGLTLGGYLFTDITSDLMSKWIDRVASAKDGHGEAMALAGFRGVGKSHFLAVLGAIVSRPDLRSEILDAHVGTAAERLGARRSTVVFVRRGSGSTLLEELKSSISDLTGCLPESLSDFLPELLAKIRGHGGDMQPLLLIDTDLSRDKRVDRDDGAFLSEIADVAKSLGLFTAVALDDDISGADGANLSIAGNYTIDYLDQEHLYKIVDTHIFSKQSKMLSVLHDVYDDYRRALPGFRWSEQKFASLYPLHPAILEVAPLIRLYIHDFALLKFASEAGVKVLGRPANSLIGLDEVFDGVEKLLRDAPELSDTFAAFDRIEKEVVSQISVHSRLPAKLILKGLLLLSLDGVGISASGMASSMMIYGENVPGGSTIDVAEILESFASALPDAISATVSESGETRYAFKLDPRDVSDQSFSSAIKAIPDEEAWQELHRLTAEKFSGLAPTVTDGNGNGRARLTINWRGSLRRGLVIWNPEQSETVAMKADERTDWCAIVNWSRDASTAVSNVESVGSMEWKVAEPTSKEMDLLRWQRVLQTDESVREHFGEELDSVIGLNMLAVASIWQRIFFADSEILVGGVGHGFDGDLAGQTVQELVAQLLDPIFDEQFPDHPHFRRPLGARETSVIISHFFSGSSSKDADIQEYAETFAFPLGLAELSDREYRPVTNGKLLEIPIIRSVFAGAGAEPDQTIPIIDISRRLGEVPFGLSQESQHLILAAMVGQRHYEFITTSGNRINHRSLDLPVLWDDIVGLAVPLEETYGEDRLLIWSRLITGNSGIRSLKRPEDQSLIIDSLTGWLEGWKKANILDEFDALPDESLNAAIWKIAARLRRSFGAVAQTIETLGRGKISLEECLYNIANHFSDSEEEFESKKNDLRRLEIYRTGIADRNRIKAYLSLAEITNEPAVENARQQVLSELASSYDSLVPVTAVAESKWQGFLMAFEEHYATRHSAVMGRDAVNKKVDEILHMADWTVFQTLAKIPWFDEHYGSRTKRMIRELRQSYCSVDPSERLAQRPFCTCSFSLGESQRITDLSTQIELSVTAGVAAFWGLLEGEIAKNTKDPKAKAIILRLGDVHELRTLTSEELQIIADAVEGDELGTAAMADLTAENGSDLGVSDFDSSVFVMREDPAQVSIRG